MNIIYSIYFLTQGGCVDTSNTPLACLMMTLSSNVSKILTGELDNPTYILII